MGVKKFVDRHELKDQLHQVVTSQDHVQEGSKHLI